MKFFQPFKGRPQKSPEYLAAERRFSAEELQHIQDAFTQAAPKQGAALDQEHLKALLRLHEEDAWLAGRLFAALSDAGSSPGSRGVTLERLVITLASCVKGSPEELADFTHRTMSSSGSGTKHADTCRQLVQACARWSTQAEASPAFLDAAVAGYMACKQNGGEEGSRQHVRRWAKAVPMVPQTLQELLATPAAAAHGAAGKGGKPASMARPQLLFPSSTTHQATLDDCLIRPEGMWALKSWLPRAQTEVWELLFNSRLHGGSFNTFMGRCSSKGPTLTLIRDKGGAVFGGYAAEDWAKHGQFYGNASSFVFSVLPNLARFTAGGANANVQYCGHNFAQLPNGFGFGGQPGYFGVFVDSTFEAGMSRPCATFSNPSLSSEQVFQVDAVECWLVQQPEPEDAPPPGKAGGSVLDRFKEDRHLLDLAGRGTQASAGIREARPEDDL